jgi:16S rRNA (adenine(1408)-N(1))-methyltransferase
VTVILPWGSLLAAVARPSLPELSAMRGVCRPGAPLTVVLGGDPTRDRAEVARIGVSSLSLVERREELATTYATAGFALAGVREIDAADPGRWPSTWARRLSHGRGRRFWQLDATADALPGWRL